jgi:hypothetical protein
LKQSAEDLVFDISKIKIHVSLAVGLCSTEFEDSSAKLDFEEYCVQAAQALATSLDTSNKRIIRYDETYEKKLDDDKGAYTFSTPSTVTPVESDEASIDAFGDFFSDILSGDYSNIPTEFLPTLIEPLENFLQYAHSALQDVKKVSGE